MAAQSLSHTAGMAKDIVKLKAKMWWSDVGERLTARSEARHTQYVFDETITMELTIHSAKVHIATDSNGLSDPYVKILDADGEKLGKTKVQKKTLTPDWQQVFYIKVLPNDPIILLLYDENSVAKDEYLGCVAITAKCQRQGGDGAPTLIPQKDQTVEVKRKGKNKKDGTETETHYADLTYTLQTSSSTYYDPSKFESKKK